MSSPLPPPSSRAPAARRTVTPRHAKRTAPAARATAPQRRSQAERSDESEARLLEAAARVIESEGFAAATFERIGEMAGYSRGLASAKFGSKDGLVGAVIAFVEQRVQARLDQSLPHTDSASPDNESASHAAISHTTISHADHVRIWSDTFLAAVQSDTLIRAYFVMMAAAVGNRAEIRSAFLAAHENVRTQLRAMIEAGQATGEIPAHINADATALSIGSLQLGIATELLLDPALDMDMMRATARHAVTGMLGI